MESTITWLNMVGLSLGAIGSFGLALLTKVFITIKPDGHQTWGPPDGVTNDEWLQQNRRLRLKQKYGLPFSYGALGAGFLLQLVAIWFSALAK